MAFKNLKGCFLRNSCKTPRLCCSFCKIKCDIRCTDPHENCKYLTEFLEAKEKPQQSTSYLETLKSISITPPKERKSTIPKREKK